ncbi:hypothetical protein RC083_12145 [Pseudoalteromonas haloplanktis]|uniref:Orphan protein n=1 Tax=Pseudoalteromonas haloplanktis TaxID=228 RepID=A0ABU1BCW2_PSEHA|nr:hypothetical protein [Pseudoalteromonas haloplanktis]MDQ9092338.1 hypothetical protein [Pseudoalteromonas haloplanktis]
MAITKESYGVKSCRFSGLTGCKQASQSSVKEQADEVEITQSQARTEQMLVAQEQVQKTQWLHAVSYETMPQGMMHANASISLMPPMPRPIADDAKRSAS